MSDLARLATPFPPAAVKGAAPGKFGNYVPHDIVNQAALAIVGPFHWKVREFIYGADGVTIEGCVGHLRARIDGEWITVEEIGDCEQPANWKTNGQRAKDAASDAFKRCWMRESLGLHLWSGADYFLDTQLAKRENDLAGEARGQSAETDHANGEESLGPLDTVALGADPNPRPEPVSATSGAVMDMPVPSPPDYVITVEPGDETPVSLNQINHLQARISALNAIKGFAFSERKKAAGLPLLTKSVSPEVFADYVALVAQCEEEMGVRSRVS